MNLAGGGGIALTKIVDITRSCNITFAFTSPAEAVGCSVSFPAFAQTPTVKGIILPTSDMGQLGSRSSIIGDFSFISPGAVPVTWTSMPLATTEFLGTVWHEGAMDFTMTDDCNTIVNVVTAGTAGANLKIQYSADGGLTWFDVMPGQDVSIAATGLQINGNAGIAEAARIIGGVLIRLVGYGGNGIVSPQFGDIELFCASQIFQVPILTSGAITTTSASIILDTSIITPNAGQTVTFHPTIDLCFPCAN